GKARRMPQPASKAYTLAFQPRPAFWKSEQALHNGIEMKVAYARIVPKVDLTMMGVSCFIIDPPAGFEMSFRLGKLADGKLCRPGTMVRLQHDRGVIKLPCNPEKIGRDLAAPIEPTAGNVK